MLALVIAAVGVYGLLAYSVAQRTQEIGVRMALGARRGTVVAMVIREGAQLVALGLVAGLLSSLVAARLLTSWLYRTSPHDAVTFAAVVAVLGAVALLASALPAWRAARVDPITALPAE